MPSLHLMHVIITSDTHIITSDTHVIITSDAHAIITSDTHVIITMYTVKGQPLNFMSGSKDKLCAN